MEKLLRAVLKWLADLFGIGHEEEEKVVYLGTLARKGWGDHAAPLAGERFGIGFLINPATSAHTFYAGHLGDEDGFYVLKSWEPTWLILGPIPYRPYQEITFVVNDQVRRALGVAGNGRTVRYLVSFHEVPG